MILKKKFHPEVKGAIAFGLMDGIAGFLGIVIGVYAAGFDQFAIAAAALAGGIADSFANAAGTHVSQEVERGVSDKFVWRSTIAAFITTVIIAILLVIPIVLMELETGIIISFVLGLSILFFTGLFSIKSLRAATKYAGMGIAAAILGFLAGSLIKVILLK